MRTRTLFEMFLYAVLELCHNPKSKISGRNSMVECQLPKLKVASSSLVARSKLVYCESTLII